MEAERREIEPARNAHSKGKNIKKFWEDPNAYFPFL
jgi:hypothetical protein